MKNLQTNCLLTISYLGTHFHGWQIQPNKRTVQGVIEEVMSKVFVDNIAIIGSGRTDAGVHAIRAKANALLPTNFLKKHFYKNGFLFEKLITVLNSYLPSDVRILAIKKVKNSFNARFDAKSKTYEYRVQTSGILSPFDADKYLFFNKNLDVAKMIEASKYLIGKHDFTAFCSAQTATNDHIRTIFDIKIRQIKNKTYFNITGNGFLYNMVRIIVGTLIDVGCGKIEPIKVLEILNSKNRTQAGKTLPPHALYLKQVNY